MRKTQPPTRNSTNVEVNVNIDLNSIATIPRSRCSTANGGGRRGGSFYREAEEPGGNENRKNSTFTFDRQHAIRSNYMGKSIEAKKKVILFITINFLFLLKII